LVLAMLATPANIPEYAGIEALDLDVPLPVHWTQATGLF